MTPPCPPETHAFATNADGVQSCARCGLVPCANPLDHDWSVHPEHTTLHPPTFDMICRTCGERRVWNPGAGRSMSDPHVLEHDHDALAVKFGHPLHEPTPAPALPGLESVPKEYLPTKRGR